MIRKEKHIYGIFLALLIVFASYQLIRSATLCRSTYGVDFGKHYRAYELIEQGENPYKGENYLILNYPVFTIWLFSWMRFFDFPTAELLWDLWNLVLIVLSACVVAFAYAPPGQAVARDSTDPLDVFRNLIRRHWRIWGFFLLLYYLPPVIRVFSGNLEPTMLFFLVLFGAAYFKEQHVLAGVFLAFSIMVKVMSIFILPCIIIMGRWNILKGVAITFITYAMLLLATGRWRWEWFLASDVLINAGYVWKNVSASMVCLVSDVVLPSARTHPEIFKNLSIGINSLLLIITGAVLVVARLRNRSFDRVISFNFLLLPLLTPLLEYHHHTWMVVAYFIFWREFLIGTLTGFRWFVVFGLWIIMIATGYLVNLGFSNYYPATVATLALYLLYGIDLVWGKNEAPLTPDVSRNAA